MDIVTLPTHRPMTITTPTGVAAAAVVLIGSSFAVNGSGSVFEVAYVRDWCSLVQPRVSFLVEARTSDRDGMRRCDLRSATDHLVNIRQVLNPAIVELSAVFDVSRQAIYKWLGGESAPEPDKLERIRALSLAADAFREAGITHAGQLLKMKAFEGLSLMDLVARNRLLPSHTQTLIAEMQAMDAAYHRSGLEKTKGKPSEDWRSELSIPTSSER